MQKDITFIVIMMKVNLQFSQICECVLTHSKLFFFKKLAKYFLHKQT